MILSSAVVLPVASPAQTSTTGAIAGLVRDSTGGVLPGVTVEAASPALIEKVRVVTSDDQGQYRIVDLRPGEYVVTFSLAGFSSIKREGLVLNSGVTLPVNVELGVGSVEETITVSGASPVVDVQNVRTQSVLTREVLDALPTSKTTYALASLTLGAKSQSGVGLGVGDNGGSSGYDVTGINIHMQGEGLKTVDGLRINSGYDNPPTTNKYVFNAMQAQEMVLETSGASAESASGGVNVNMVSKSGGNTTTASIDLIGTNSNFQSSNLNDELRARGINTENKTRKVYDIGFGIGGPLVRDRLWYYTAHRVWGNEEYQAGAYYNKTQGTLAFTPDPDRPAFYDKDIKDSGLRLTFQATEKQKIAGSANLQDFCWCVFNLVNRAPEATWEYKTYPSGFFQGSYTYPVSSKLLFEAGAGYRLDRDINRIPDVTGNARSILELATGFTYGSDFVAGHTAYGDMGNQWAYQTRAVASYITGTHAIKFGVQTASSRSGVLALGPIHNVQYVLRNGVPNSVNLINGPFNYESRMKLDLGLFVQDQWTMRKLTLNLGVRFDHLNSYNPEQTRLATEFSPAETFPEQRNVPNWKDISPRLGVAYDLFGNGRTAIKASFGRYPIFSNTDLTKQINAANATALSTSRTWNDANGNFVPDCVMADRAANGECGPMANQAFGTRVFQKSYDKSVTEGWWVRPYQLQTSLVLQHELRPGLGLNLGYFRTSFGNWATGGTSWTGNPPNVLADNLAVTAADFSAYCITAPSDPRLPGGGENQICGLYDVVPGKFGQVNYVVSQDIGKWTRVYNGFEAQLNARLGAGATLVGGVSAGRTVTDKCATPDAPAQFCRTTDPFKGDLQFKLSGTYPLPWFGLRASGKVQNLPGLPVTATYAAPNSLIAPSLGRDLAACGNRIPCTATANVMLFAPGTQFEDRFTIVDIRISRSVRFGRMRIEPKVDVYNLFNSTTVLQQVTTFGPNYRRPIAIYGARLMQFGVQVDF